MIQDSLESPPRWIKPSQEEIAAACTAAGKPVSAFAEELEPALLAVVRQVEKVLHNAPNRTDTKGFIATNVLRINLQTGDILIRIFTCVNGHCDVPAETTLAMGIREIRKMGWGTMGFDFERNTEE